MIKRRHQVNLIRVLPAGQKRRSFKEAHAMVGVSTKQSIRAVIICRKFNQMPKERVNNIVDSFSLFLIYLLIRVFVSKFPLHPRVIIVEKIIINISSRKSCCNFCLRVIAHSSYCDNLSLEFSDRADEK